jgi:hypothetical protein
VSELKPCAHCASKDVELRQSIADGYIACNNCGCRTGLVFYGASDASNAARDRELVEVWNTRASPTNDGEGLIERLREAAKPWADYHGDLPDYDHPLRPVFESGVQYAVELLAKMLHVEDWEICDGTEEFDGDLGGTLLNIVIKTWPTDQNGDWLDLRDPETLAALNQGAGR